MWLIFLTRSKIWTIRITQIRQRRIQKCANRTIQIYFYEPWTREDPHPLVYITLIISTNSDDCLLKYYGKVGHACPKISFLVRGNHLQMTNQTFRMTLTGEIIDCLPVERAAGALVAGKMLCITTNYLKTILKVKSIVQINF